MNNTVFICVLLLAFIFSFLSCHPLKKIVQATHEPVVLKTEPADTVFEKVLHREFQFQWLSAKADIDYTESSGDKISFSVNMRACNDSVIWLSVAPLLGIEAVRALISRDSVHLLDRVHHSYIRRDYQYLDDLLKIKVTFSMLQAIITGKYFSGIDGEKIQSVYEESPYYILSTLPKLKTIRTAEENNPEHPRVQDFWIDTDYRIVKTKIQDDPLKRALTVEYNNFTSVKDKFFPRLIRLLAESNKSAVIEIKYTKFSFDGPLNFPFSVSEKYSKE